jgi:diguanylate cyclase (GGDEF)-like protein
MPGFRERIRGRRSLTKTSGLADADQRSLLRLICIISGCTLAFFALLQSIEGRYLLAAVEVTASILLFYASGLAQRARNVTLWVYVYLIPLFCFLVYIIVMPGASPVAFVWVYLVPILSYLLLGRAAGFMLATPVVVLVALAYLSRYGIPEAAAGWIDLGNAALSGLLVLVFVHLYEGRRAAAQHALQAMADTDALTGVANRGRFQAYLERSIQESSRTHAPFVLVILDVDLFKKVNDRWGHDVGDAALQHICNCLSERLRATDFMGRMGGEEFGIVLGNIDMEAAIPLVEDLRGRIADSELKHEGQRVPLSATFGLAQWPTDGENASVLYRNADRRLYYGKAAGRNQLVSRDEA